MLRHSTWLRKPFGGRDLINLLAPCRGIIISLSLILSLLIVQTLPGPIGTGSSAFAASWHLRFHDEFNGATLDRTKWSTTYPWGARTNAGNHELEYYTDNAFQLAEGVLRIRAAPHRTQGFKYTSGIITSYSSFNLKYGYVEVRAKVPQGRGLWPAVWLAPHDESWPPEIDILEVQGNRTTANEMSNHYRKSSGPTQTDHEWMGPDFSKGFHTFGLEWSPKQLTWYIDGLERFRTNVAIPSKPMYVIANLAVGGNWVGPPNAKTTFPSYLQIAYIRIYQRS
jgi:beta-glucanase (GH16 family)